MALKHQSLFLYNLEVTATNSSIDFKISGGGSQLSATLTVGFYSLTSLCTEVVRALTAADPSNTYTCTVNRNVAGGTQNRITISTSGSFLSLLFASGTRTASTAAPLLGFAVADQTGHTTYTGTLTCGTALIPDLVGYNFLSPDFMHKVFGNLSISASGVKEAVIFQVQKFWQVQFKYEPEAKVIVQWTPFLDWVIQQRLLEFTPDVTTPNTFYEGTLETTTDDGKGLGYKMMEMLPNFPFFYDSGLMKFRVNQT